MRRILIRQKGLFLTLILISILVGCASRQQVFTDEEAAPIFDWHGKTPESFLKDQRAEYKYLSSFTAYFNISMDPPPSRLPSSFSGVLYLSKNGQDTKIRIKAFQLFGNILFDMVSANNKTEIYVPARRTLYRGTPPRKEGDKSQGPQEVFSSLMVDFSTVKPSPESGFIFSDNEVVMSIEDGEIKLDRKSGLIKSISRAGQEINYSRYKSFTDHSPMPTRITIRALDGSQEATCNLDQITLHDDLSGSFDLSGYRPKHTKDLKDIK